MSKYNARKTTQDGITFDSLAEARRYGELKELMDEGKISGLRVHPKYELIPAYVHNDKRVRATAYIADFEYTDRSTMQTVIEDVKGVETAVFKLKRKLFEWRYPHFSIRIVTLEEL